MNENPFKKQSQLHCPFEECELYSLRKKFWVVDTKRLPFFLFSIFSKISPGNVYLAFDLETVLNDTTG